MAPVLRMNGSCPVRARVVGSVVVMGILPVFHDGVPGMGSFMPYRD
jgi:hypothetical protein